MTAGHKRRGQKRVAVIALVALTVSALLIRWSFSSRASHRTLVSSIRVSYKYRKDPTSALAQATAFSISRLRRWSPAPSSLSRASRVTRSLPPSHAAHPTESSSPTPARQASPEPVSAAPPACPAFTSLHPVLAEASVDDEYTPLSLVTGVSTDSRSDAPTAAPYHNATVQALEAYGLRPVQAAPVKAQSEPAWRGSSVEVLSERTTEPLTGARRRAERSDEEVRQRLHMHRRCITMEGPRGTATAVASKGLLNAQYVHAAQVIHDRITVLAHGLLIHQQIQEWLETTSRNRFLDKGYTTTEQPWHQGPWIEDYWISTFARPVTRTLSWDLYQSLLAAKVSPSTVPALQPRSTRQRQDPAHVTPYEGPTGERVIDVLLPYDVELFHPWVPLFIPWEAIMTSIARVHELHIEAVRHSLLCSLAVLLQQILRTDLQYITLTQRAMGPWVLEYSDFDPVCALPLHMALTNVLVLSSGGIGHVPIPLLGGELPFLGCSANTTQPEHKVVFVGSRREGLRSDMWRTVSQIDPFGVSSLMKTPQTIAAEKPAPAAFIGASKYSFLHKMATGAYQLAPRGTGPTSFRLYEALQMGLVPVFIHDGQPWLPYLKPGQSWQWQDEQPVTNQSLWARIAVVVHMDHFQGWMQRLYSSDPSDALWHRLTEFHHQERKIAIAQVRDRFFTYDGVMRRLAEWLDDPHTADLTCSGSSFL